MKYLPSIQLSGLIRSCAGMQPSDLLARLTEDGFYRVAETRVFDDSVGRPFEMVCRERDIFWMCWASNVIYEEGLNLSSLEKSWREHSLKKVSALMDRAAQQGAHAFAFLSGARPENEAKLPEALKWAEDSICELARRAKQYGGFRLLIEPLDRDVHKHAAIGTAAEAAAVIRAARQEHPHFYMVWDSAHMKLQEGDLSASLRDAGDTVGHIHLCDAVIDPQMPLYGDFHPMPGIVGGFLDEACMMRILREAAALELSLAEIPVTIEAKPDGNPWKAELVQRGLLRRLLEP